MTTNWLSRSGTPPKLPHSCHFGTAISRGFAVIPPQWTDLLRYGRDQGSTIVRFIRLMGMHEQAWKRAHDRGHRIRRRCAKSRCRQAFVDVVRGRVRPRQTSVQRPDIFVRIRSFASPVQGNDPERLASRHRFGDVALRGGQDRAANDQVTQAFEWKVSGCPVLDAASAVGEAPDGRSGPTQKRGLTK